MIRFAIDTDQPDKLTSHVELLMTYSDLVPDYAAISARFPQSKVLLIDRGLGDPTGLASIFDIERGTLNDAQAIRRYDEQQAKGVPFLTVYHDRSSADQVKAAFHPRQPWHIYATLDGTAHITGYTPLEGPAAVQCLSAGELGYHADGHLVFEDAWNPTRFPANLASAQTDVHHAMYSTQATIRTLQNLASLLGA